MVHKLVDLYRQYGLVTGLFYGIDRMLQRLSSRLRFHAYQIMVQPITDRPLLPERHARRFEFREIRRGDPEVGLMPARPDIKEARFAQSAVCLGAFRDGRLTGYLWFCYGRYEEDEARCTYVVAPEGHAVFDYDLYVLPEHRMGSAFAGIWHGASEYLRNRGIRYTFSRYTRFNLASRRAHERLGGRPVGSAVFLQLGPIQLMAATLWPFLHVSLSRSQRVTLRLRPAEHRCKT
jgi:acetyltransferase (GNAT) family protein